MALLYIDTNVFLDFYQASTDRLKVFHNLVSRANKVILTEQTNREFRRNRLARLSVLAREIEQKSSPQIFTTAVVKELPGFERWVKLKDDYQSQAKLIVNELRKWSQDETSDLVLTEFNNLVHSCTVIPTTPENIAKAQTRKILGDPPTSPDKHTIGDELIWETLLDGCTDDLIIVSRDKTFLENVSILKAEFEKCGSRRLLLVTDKLGEALKTLSIPSPDIEEAEKVIEAARPKISPLATLICPKCGGQLEETGFEGSDGDEAWWLYCLKCGHEVFPEK